MNSDIRRYALAAALDSYEKHDYSPTTSGIIERAAEFEKFINTGYTPEEPKRAQDA